MLQKRPDAALAALVSLAAAALAVWPLLAAHGLPMYQHDWSWPFDAARYRDAFAVALSAWEPEGLGHANPFVSANPVTFFALGLGALAGGELALRVYLLACLVLAGLGAARLARRCGGASFAAPLASGVYVLSPVVANKLGAGHTAYLAAYAALPWLAASFAHALNGGGRRALCRAIAWAACTAAQPQFLAFSTIVVVALALAHPRRGRALGAAAAVVVALALADAPSLVAALGEHAGFAYTVAAPNASWERALSAPWWQSARMLGYVVPYADRAYAASAVLSVALALLALAGWAGLVARAPAAIGVLLAALAGEAIAPGYGGPLAPVLDAFFAHVPGAATFREFYHAEALVALGLAAGVARLGSRGALPAIALSALGALALCAPLPSRAEFLAPRTIPASVASARAAVLRDAPSGRYLPLPYRMPIALGDSPRSGVDVLAALPGDHPSAAEYGATPELDALAGLVAARDVRAARRIASALELTGLSLRTGLRSESDLARDVSGGAAIRARARAAFDDLDAYPRALPVVRHGTFAALVLPRRSRVVSANERWSSIPRDATDVDVPYAAPALTFPNRTGTPRDGWVPAQRWRWLRARWADLLDPLAVTLGPSTLGVDARAGVPLLVFSSDPIEICTPACRTERAPRVAFDARGDTRVIAHGPAALAIASRRVAPGGVMRIASTRLVSPWLGQAVTLPEGDTLVTLATRYDDGWVLVGARGLHVRANGYANGWIVRSRNSVRVRARFGPQIHIWTACIVAFSAWGAIIAGIFAPPAQFGAFLLERHRHQSGDR